MPSEHYKARVIYTLELDGSLTREVFGDDQGCLVIERSIKDHPVESEQMRAIRTSVEQGGHGPGSDF